MRPARFPKLRARFRQLWNSDRAAALRFYGYYLRGPLLLALAALAGEKAIYYGALPLAGLAGREWNYIEAERDFRAERDTDALYRIREALFNTRDSARLWRLAAQITERLDSPEAAYCWQQVDRLEPGVPATQLALADASLRHGELELAAAALREVTPEYQAGPDYLIAAGQLAQAEGKPERAGYFFDEATALRPRDAASLFALADWRASRREGPQARVLLETLAARPGSSLEAFRELVNIDMQQHDLRAAWTDEARLLSLPGATFADRIRQLDFSPDPALSLATLLRGADPADAACVLNWMSAHGQAEKALIWIRSQDETWQDDPVIGLARAGCLQALGEWEHLRDDQRDSFWPGHESTRLMLLAEASLKLGQTDDARAAWHGAVAAFTSPQDFNDLTRAADAFPDPDEARADVWLAIADHYPGQQWPLRALLRYELGRGDLVSAQNVAVRLAALVPEDATISATRDLLQLLRDTEVPQAEADLAVLELREPGDADVATAAAYSLYLQGRFADALATIGALEPAELCAPERAPYLGELLAAAGPPRQAEATLEVALAQPHLLQAQERGIKRALDLATTRRVLADLLDPSDAAARSRAAAFFAAQTSTGEAVYWIGASVADLGDRSRAAADLARIDPTALNRSELLLEEGAVRALCGPLSEAEPWLRLSPDLPVEAPGTTWHRIVETWWKNAHAAPFDAAVTTALLNSYRGLDATEPDPAFWCHDQTRELELTRSALEAAQVPEAVQARLEALLRHVPATPEIEAQVGYALFLQGRVEAGRQRLEVLSPIELAQPEPARYYAAILRACGETKKAATYTLLAAQTGPPKLP